MHSLPLFIFLLEALLARKTGRTFNLIFAMRNSENVICKLLRVLIECL